jgi:hypothetical protein
METCRRALLVALLLVIAAHGAHGQTAPLNPLAGKWTGVDQNNHPVTLELVVKGEEATGTLSVGPDPVKTLTNGKALGTTVTFTTPNMMNGREIAIIWRGELKDDRLTFARRLAGGPEMPSVSLQRSLGQSATLTPADAKPFLGVWSSR